MAKEFKIVSINSNQRYDRFDYDTAVVDEVEVYFFDLDETPASVDIYIKENIIETDDNMIMSISGLTQNEINYYQVEAASGM